MSKRLLIDSNQCWWKNFRDSISGDFDSTEAFAIQRDKVLKENHRAEIKMAAGSFLGSHAIFHCLEFETEQDAMWFVLKWS